jgi:hypothetical protein
VAEVDPTTASKVGLMLLAASEVPNFLAGMLPSLMTIRRFSADERDTATLRRGEVAGSALSLAVGAGASIVARSWLPLIATGTILVVMLVMYEQAIRNPHEDAKPISDASNTNDDAGAPDWSRWYGAC